jgi:hypothetical protein
MFRERKNLNSFSNNLLYQIQTSVKILGIKIKESNLKLQTIKLVCKISSVTENNL